MMLATTASQVTPFDLQRMFLGDTPLLFLLEIAFRTGFIYLFAFAMVRVVGRRGVGQLTLIEFFLVIALGSAVGDPMFYPDVPLVHAMIVIAVVVAASRGVTWLTNASDKAEALIEGQPQWLVHHGQLDVEGMSRADLNREQLFELLRNHAVRHLGEVEEAFFEQRGTMSLYCAEKPRRGMRVMPPWDLETPTMHYAGEHLARAMALACSRCGTVKDFEAGTTLEKCTRCDGEEWANAVVEPSS